MSSKALVKQSAAFTRWCPHCSQYLSKRTFLDHKLKYHNKEHGWGVGCKKPQPENCTSGSGMPVKIQRESKLTSSLWCPHCSQYLSKRTFLDHKLKYHNKEHGWSAGCKKPQPDNCTSGRKNVRTSLHLINLWCPHCSQFVSKRTFLNHKLKHYDTKHGWVIEQQTPQTDSCTSDSEDGTDEEALNVVNTDHKMHEGQTPTPQENKSFTSPIEGHGATGDDIDNSEQNYGEFSCQEDSSDSDSGSEVWSEEDPDEVIGPTINTGDAEVSSSQASGNYKRTCQSAMMWLLFFLCLWHSVNMISNNSLDQLLGFFRAWLQSIPDTGYYVTTLSSLLPTSLYACYRYLGISKDNYTKFVVCKKCLKLYRLDDCFVQEGNDQIPKVCQNQVHAGRQRLQKCGGKLMNKIKCKGKIRYHPVKVYCFKSVIDTLESFLLRPGFQEECEKWRKRTSNGYIADVYDGRVWKEFNTVNGDEFLSKRNNFAFMINIDWFQPFKRRPDISVGAIYMVLMNLPREKRFRHENVFLVGIIPSLNKEPSCLNSFLDPLIEELLVLFKGLKLQTFQCKSGEIVRAALLATAADIPASRKLSGFLSHSAQKGCSRCLKSFPGSFGEKRNYSGFDRDNWPQRTLLHHKACIQKILAAKTLTKRRELESKFGVRYSALLKLPYFNPIRQSVIDPMHNLFLGIAKKCFKIWIDRDILTKTKLDNMVEKIAQLEIGCNIGRLPSKISSNYGSFTAEQWRNWICIYSMYVLDGYLPRQHLKCWQSFVLACRHLCHPTITLCDVTIADNLFLKFAREYEVLYGGLSVTPNLHLMGHLKECVLDYGSVYGFWLFAFERYNGILGSFHTNNKNIEPQLMSKFLTLTEVYNVQFSMPVNIFSHVKDMVSSMYLNDSFPHLQSEISLGLLRASHGPLNPEELLAMDFVKKPHRYKIMSVDSEMLQHLKEVYALILPEGEIASEFFPATVKVFDTVSVQKIVYGSKRQKSKHKAAKITAKWSTSSGHIDYKEPERLGEIAYFIEHYVKFNGSYISTVFAIVDWYCLADRQPFMPPVQVFSAESIIPQGPSRFLPVWRIHSQCAVANDTYDGRNVLVVVPISQKIYL